MVNPDPKISRPARCQEQRPRAARLSSRCSSLLLTSAHIGPPCPSLHQGNSEIKVHGCFGCSVISNGVRTMASGRHKPLADRGILASLALSTFRYHHCRPVPCFFTHRYSAPIIIRRGTRLTPSGGCGRSRHSLRTTARLAAPACHIQTRRCIVSARGPPINGCSSCTSRYSREYLALFTMRIMNPYLCTYMTIGLQVSSSGTEILPARS